MVKVIRVGVVRALSWGKSYWWKMDHVILILFGVIFDGMECHMWTGLRNWTINFACEILAWNLPGHSIAGKQYRLLGAGVGFKSYHFWMYVGLKKPAHWDKKDLSPLGNCTYSCHVTPENIPLLLWCPSGIYRFKYIMVYFMFKGVKWIWGKSRKKMKNVCKLDFEVKYKMSEKNWFGGISKK